VPLKLIIANKAYSSWSLRPWILLAQLKIPFEEVVIPMDHFLERYFELRE
jgi:glutathione S-transferase